MGLLYAHRDRFQHVTFRSDIVNRIDKFAHTLAFGFFIPGSLGAALTWFVDAVAAYWGNDNRGIPSGMEIAFALWFTSYQALWFMQSWQMGEPTSTRKYTRWHLLLDVVEMGVVFTVLAILKTNPGVTGDDELFQLWLAVALIPVIAILANGKEIVERLTSRDHNVTKTDVRYALATVGLAIAGFAALANLAHWNTGRTNVIAFALLCIATGFYAYQILFDPQMT
jgi:hypothetical protein